MLFESLDRGSWWNRNFNYSIIQT